MTLACSVLLAGSMVAAEKNIWLLRPMVSLSNVVRYRADWYPDAEPRSVSAGACRVEVTMQQHAAVAVRRFVRVNCNTPATGSAALFVLGDSHADSYESMVRKYVRETGATAWLYARGGCAVMGLEPNEPAPCATFLHAAQTDIAQHLRARDVVFLPGLRIPRLADEYATYGKAHAEGEMFDARAEAWRETSRQTAMPWFTELSQAGADIVLEAPLPVFPSAPFRCADWFNKGNAICAPGTLIERHWIEALRAPVLAQFEAVRRLDGSIQVWDPMAILCPSDPCNAFLNGKPLFFDGDHLSGYGNRFLEPHFRRLLADLPRPN